MMTAMIAAAGVSPGIATWGPTTLTAIVGFLVWLTTWWNAKRGRADTANQQDAANKIAADAQQFEQQQALIAEHVKEIARLRDARSSDQERHDAEVIRIRESLEHERERHREHSTAQNEVIALLRSIVADEIHKSAIDSAVAMGVSEDELETDLLAQRATERLRGAGYDDQTKQRRERN